MVRSFYKGVSAIVLLYSIDNEDSFNQLSDWMKEVKEHAHSETLIYVIASKLDLEDNRKVGTETGKKFGNGIDASAFMEVSAKTG